jgi:hypothetical protein
MRDGGGDLSALISHPAAKQKSSREARMALSARQHMLREKSRLLGDMFSLMLRREALLLRLKYDPAQPRIPAGQPGGGRWAGESGAGGNAEVLVAGSLEKTDPDTNISQFISQHCKGGIHREMPGQFYQMTIGEMLALRNSGDRAADTCYKLLDRGRFRK